MIQLGTDIIETARIRDSFVKFGDRFKKRIFTLSEQEYCDRQKYPELHYAARFCAKEAVSKALKTGIAGGIRWTDIEIKNNPITRAPFVVLYGKALEYYQKLRGKILEVSLAHTVTMAQSVAVIECGEGHVDEDGATHE